MFEETGVIKELGWDKVFDANIRIGKFLGYEPKIEYCVGNEKTDTSCFSPKNISSQFSDPYSQKRECEKFLEEQRVRFPDGWVLKEGNTVRKLEWYPQFHNDFNFCIDAVKRLMEKGIRIELTVDINELWKIVSNHCH